MASCRTNRIRLLFQRSLSSSSKSFNKSNLPEIVIVGAARTPIGSFRSLLSSVSAVELGATAIRAAVSRANVEASAVQEVFMGQVCQANTGQNPAKQAALGAGLEVSTITTTVNKVCASGLKAIMLAAQTLQAGHQRVTIGGGMESMSQVPFYLPRGELPYGGFKVVLVLLQDAIVEDGLTDAYKRIHMGLCAEKTAEEFSISREEQDSYAIQSYKKTASAWMSGAIGAEICPVTVKSRKGESVVAKDEEFTKVNFDKLPKLKTAFKALKWQRPVSVEGKLINIPAPPRRVKALLHIPSGLSSALSA